MALYDGESPMMISERHCPSTNRSKSYDDIVLVGRKSPVSTSTLEIDSKWGKDALSSPKSRKPRRGSITGGGLQMQALWTPTTPRKDTKGRRKSIGEGSSMTSPNKSTHRIKATTTASSEGSGRTGRKTSLCGNSSSHRKKDDSSMHRRTSVSVASSSKTQRGGSDHSKGEGSSLHLGLASNGGSDHSKEERSSSHRRNTKSFRQAYAGFTDGYKCSQQIDWGHTNTEIGSRTSRRYQDGTSPRQYTVSNDSRSSSSRMARRNSIGTGSSCHRRSCFDTVAPSAYGYKVAVPSSPFSSSKLTKKTSSTSKDSPLLSPNNSCSTTRRRASMGHTNTCDHRRAMQGNASLTNMIERSTFILKKEESTRSHMSAFSSTGWTVSSQESTACFSSTGWSVDGSDDVLCLKPKKDANTPRRGRRPLETNEDSTNE
eukprot:scaffold6814_cov151-Amphora_coffeaeformis.AAC.3